MPRKKSVSFRYEKGNDFILFQNEIKEMRTAFNVFENDYQEKCVRIVMFCDVGRYIFRDDKKKEKFHFNL